MAMTTTLVKENNASLSVTFNAGTCSPLVYTTIRLYKDGVIYNTFTTTALYNSYNLLPGGSYYVTVTGYTTGDVQCDTGTSNTIVITPFCIPSNATNMSFRRLARFYGIDTDNIFLSGPNNPSTPGSLFGNSGLPASGAISRATPNAVSELRSACLGIMSWEDTATDEVQGIVAVGDSGTILRSLNGTTWTVVTPVQSGALYCLSYATQYMFAAGIQGSLLKTLEGFYWSIKSSGSTTRINGAWSSNQRNANIKNYICGIGGLIRTSSSDLVDDWVTKTSGTTANLNAIRDFGSFSGWTLGQACIGNSGTLLKSVNAGDTWTAITTDVTNDLFAMSRSSNASRFIIGGSGGLIRTTDNGTSWTTRTTPTTAIIYSIEHSITANITVAVGEGGLIMTSPDAITWTARTSGTTNDLKSVKYIPSVDLFIAVGNGGVIRTSPDGITWTTRTSGTANNLNAVATFY